MNASMIKNTITGERILQRYPVDEEVLFDGGVMITETDLHGIITYANRKFRDMTGFSKEELVGSPHSINRHPDMPSGAFSGMWKIISSGKHWRGYVKNLRKDGKYYWVLVYIQPKLDDNGKLIGFIAGRKVAYPEQIQETIEIYAKYHGQEHINNPIFFDEGYNTYIEDLLTSQLSPI